MRVSTMVSAMVVIGLAVLPATALTERLAFEEGCLDLDTAAVTQSCQGVRGPEEPGEGWDVLVGYHGDRAMHAVVVPNPRSGVEIAHLAGRTFEEVTAEEVAGASFSGEVVDEAFDATRVLLVRTDRGAVYKLGRPIEDDDGVTLDYELLVPAP